MDPRILIIGTVPYNDQSTSRAFASYFSGWDRDCLAQVFSNPKMPVKGHCQKLFQITDQRMLKRWLNRNIATGVEYHYDELPTAWEDHQPETGNRIISALYRLGSRKSALNYLLRKLLWRKKFWNTPELNAFMDDFQPECIFLAFSDDFFIPEIAIYAAQKYNIPIVSCVGDDYYFNDHFSLSPFYHFYRSKYKKLIDCVFQHTNGAAYIGNKIRDKYNEYFHLQGRTVYLTSSVSRQQFRVISTECPKILYCGNIRLGRNQSLVDIAKVLYQINPQYRLHVYSNEADKRYYKPLMEQSNIIFHGAVPYKVVQTEMESADICVVVEGFKKRDVDISRYSLSTKVADSLACGRFVLAYGSIECGAIEYMKEIKCGLTCVSFDELQRDLPKVFCDQEMQRKAYERAVKITEENHRLENSTRVFRQIVEEAIQGNGAKKYAT